LRRWLWLLPFGIIALVPTVIYIDASAQAWLFAMIAFTLIAQGIVTLRTLSRAFQSDQHFRQMTNDLDLLLLTGVSAQAIVMRQWRVILRASIIEYALLLPLRLGLALALAHYFHLVMPGYCDYPFGSFFCYISHNLDYPYLHPFPVQIALAAVMITLFTLVEVAFVSALGVIVNATPIKRYGVGIMAGLLLRLLLPFLALSVIGPFIHVQIDPNWIYHWDLNCYDPEGNFAPPYLEAALQSSGRNPYSCQQILAIANHHRFWDTLYVAQFTLADQGVMLGANLLQPHLGHIYQLGVLDFHYSPAGTVFGFRNGGQMLQSRISAWRFLSRMLASGAIGLAVYSVLTATLLYGAYELRLRRGFLE
jgi:hypothetical protein